MTAVMLEHVEDVQFDGAAGSTQAKIKFIHKCEECREAYPHGGWTCRVSPNGDMYKGTDPIMDQAMNGAGWRNLASASLSLKTICVLCYAKLHPDEQCLKDDGNPTNTFTRRAHESKGKVSKTRNAWFLKNQAAQGRLQDTVPMGLDAIDAYERLNKSADLRKGTDWVTFLCDFISLHYSCKSCLRVPLMSNSWVRLIKLNAELTEGMSNMGEQKGGHWACAHCLAKWTHAESAAYRTIIFHDQDVQSPSDRYAFVGSLTSGQENMLMFLKGCEMIKLINGREPTKEIILEVIDQLAHVVCGSLLNLLPEIQEYKAADPSKHHWASRFQFYCEDRRLSIMEVGQPFFAADLGLLDKSPRFLEKDELDLIIDVVAATKNFMNVAHDKRTPSIKEHILYLANRPHVHDARNRMNVICQQITPMAIENVQTALPHKKKTNSASSSASGTNIGALAVHVDDTLTYTGPEYEC